jgi:hypothetical protein
MDTMSARSGCVAIVMQGYYKNPAARGEVMAESSVDKERSVILSKESSRRR